MLSARSSRVVNIVRIKPATANNAVAPYAMSGIDSVGQPTTLTIVANGNGTINSSQNWPPTDHLSTPPHFGHARADAGFNQSVGGRITALLAPPRPVIQGIESLHQGHMVMDAIVFHSKSKRHFCLMRGRLLVEQTYRGRSRRTAHGRVESTDTGRPWRIPPDGDRSSRGRARANSRKCRHGRDDA